jgi:copper chaperone CopZ
MAFMSQKEKKEMKEGSTHQVGIRHGEDVDIEGVKAAISGIGGVSHVELNYMTRKFTVIYDGTQQTLEQIKERHVGIARLTSLDTPVSTSVSEPSSSTIASL